MRKTPASKYRHRIEIQKNTPTRGTTGQSVEGWALWLYRWASIEALSGRELFAAQQFQSESTIRIRLRYDALIDGIDMRDYRFVYNSKNYDIQNVINTFEGNREMVFMCNIRNE